MHVGFLRDVRPVMWGAVLVVLGVTACARTALGLTPDSPEVKAAIRKAVKFLESEAASDNRLGARALVGLVLLKDNADEKHPKVTQAVTAIQHALGDRDPAKLKIDIYSTGLSIIFLVTLDPSKYGAEIDCLLKSLYARQKPHGGWGYPERQTGDTSMTQYGVLSAWEATQAGCRVPPEVIEGVTIWLLKTQDPSGAFGYQGTVSPSFTPVKQSNVRHSMAAAGLGSVYICADLLGFAPRPEKRDEALPPALKEVKPKQPPPQDAAKPKTRVDLHVLREVQSRGNRWMRANYDISPKAWTFYYLYALERYSSFRELAAGKAEKDPKWYNDGARYLIRTQAADGSWKGQAGLTADTAFATLFLLRSTKKSIEKTRSLGEGTLVIGRGLPQDTDQVVVRMGKVVALPRFKSAKELAPLLERPEGAAYAQAIQSLAELSPPEAEALVAQHPDVLRRLAADRSSQARVAAVGALGKARSLDHVPTLIYALGDPEAAVVRAARDALQRIARRWDAEVPAQPTDENRLAEIQQWKTWYLTVRPEAELEN